ncbi:MAG: N-acetylneuraminate synthase family protein [Kofleriaceae bacterium]
MSVFELGRTLGAGYRPFVIAALDAAKHARVEHGLAAIDAAADGGFDAVKMRALPQRFCRQLFDHAERRGMALIPTVADTISIERLDWFGSPAFEIFFDWADLELVCCAARTGKPLLLSVANASALQIGDAVELALDEGAGGVALIQRVNDASASLSCLERLRGHDAVFGVSERWIDPESMRNAVLEGSNVIEARVGHRPTVAELATIARRCEASWALMTGAADYSAMN